MDFVTLRKLAAQIGRHHTAVRADLRRRGYEIREIRTVASQWAGFSKRNRAADAARRRIIRQSVR